MSTSKVNILFQKKQFGIDYFLFALSNYSFKKMAWFLKIIDKLSKWILSFFTLKLWNQNMSIIGFSSLKFVFLPTKNQNPIYEPQTNYFQSPDFSFYDSCCRFFFKRIRAIDFFSHDGNWQCEWKHQFCINNWSE